MAKGVKLGPSSIKRSFRDLSDAEVTDIEKASTLARVGFSSGFDWEEVLRSQRVLIVSEAGVGKTYECQQQQAKLWNAGEPAFFLDLATLSREAVHDMLTYEEGLRFDAWLRSQSEIATFFLDSIDELKLTLGKFEQALKKLNNALKGQLGRTRIIITTRPVPVDPELIINYLPIPEAEEAGPTPEAFADMAMGRTKKKSANDEKPKACRNVGLMPLSREQMRDFAVAQGVSDPDALLDDISQRYAEEFAQRPQDLLELCADWRQHHRIRCHREQVETNIAVKLKPSVERAERAELSQEKAIEGASRLALAAILTRKLTIRHSADSDDIKASQAALDASRILTDWNAAAQATLLELPLFGFASYGRVRFHHRSVIEFLAAKRLDALLKRGVSFKSVKRQLFVNTAQGVLTVRPSMRPVAAWLSLSYDTIFEDIIALDPAVVLDYGDTQSLRLKQRIIALKAYVARYGHGGWRGLNTPRIQVHRFASHELSETVKCLWDNGIENPEVRDLLLQIIIFGKLNGCGEIAFKSAVDVARPISERTLAITALRKLNDPRIHELVNSIKNDLAIWPDKIARRAVIALFPTYMPVSRLSQILRRINEDTRSVDGFSYYLPRAIETDKLSPDYLDQLREALTQLIADGITWESDKFPHLRTKRPDLMASLIAACRRQAADGVRTEAWINSCLLVIRLSKDDYDGKEALTVLRRALTNLPPDVREIAFWNEAAFLESLHERKDAWSRLFELSQCGGIQLSDEKDALWIRRRLADPDEPFEHRELMLWAEMLLINGKASDHRDLLLSLKSIVADAPELVSIIDNRLRPPEDNAKLRQLEEEHAKLANDKRRRQVEAHDSWVMFWGEIAERPDAVFAADRAENTAWNLWKALKRSGHESRASGWNRRFIEEQFGKPVADRLRETMMNTWRNDRPTLRSERPDAEKDTFLVRWQFGLAGIAAEAEDRNWAKRLTEQEAELACRYAPIELNGFPSWLESLVIEHPAAIDRVLGAELSLSLSEVANGDGYSMFLQNVSYATPLIAALFARRIRDWLSKYVQTDVSPNNPQSGQNLRQAIKIIIKNGSDHDREFIVSLARQRLIKGLTAPFADIWLCALLHLNPVGGVDFLENGLKDVTASKSGVGAELFAKIFDSDYGGVGVNFEAPDFSPSLLLRLLRLTYQHIRIKDDAFHEGIYSSDTRDKAERARNAVLSALLSTTGSEGWAVKLEMTEDPLFAHIKDRVTALASEKAAEEAESPALTESECVTLDKTGETPPKTPEAMFSLMRDRLDDIDDLLLRDISPRELWASIERERLMRKEIARELANAANQCYTIDQESVTADENETDIRFRSTSSMQQGVIELKLADERSGSDLFNTIYDQLLTKYMATDECRAGCLLVTIAKERNWRHPKTGESIDFNELMIVLNDEADRLSKELGGAAKLMAKGLDLRPRLKPEK